MNTLETTFAALHTDWRALRRRVQANAEQRFAALQTQWLALRRHVQADVARWEHRLADLAEEESRLRDDGRWVHGRDDFLGVLCRHRDELSHSRLIAWLLDPCARHGLGTRVLAGVLKAVCGLSSSPCVLARARVRCEVPLVDGRLDIVVDGPGLHLVIENKVDAEEGEDQCGSYSRHLGGEAICILLSPDGRLPKTPTEVLTIDLDESEVLNRFTPLRYADFARILEQALSDGNNAASGRRVAENYLQTLRREFS